MGARGRRGGDPGGRHAAAPAWRRRFVGGAVDQRCPGRCGVGAPARARRRHRYRCAAGRADGAAPRHHRLRAELFRVHRVRSTGFPVALHAGARERERPASAMAVSCRRARARRRRDHARQRELASRTSHHLAGTSGRRASGPDRLLGLGARPGRRSRYECGHRAHSAAWRHRAFAVEARVPATAGTRHVVHRVRRADIRAWSSCRARRHAGRERCDRRECARRRVVDGTTSAGAAVPAGRCQGARLSSMAIQDRRDRRLRVARTSIASTARTRTSRSA